MTETPFPSKKRVGDPFQATTYAGFAASAQQRPPVHHRRGFPTMAATVTLVATFALGTVLGLALHQIPAEGVERPAPARIDAPTPPPAAIDEAAPLPLPSRADAVAPPPERERARATTAPRRPSRIASAVAPPRPARMQDRCRDLACQARFAELDQKLDSAFAEAVRAGAAAGPLGHEQEAWIIHRDRLSREHPELLPDLYRARIAQLQARRPGAAAHPSD